MSDPTETGQPGFQDQHSAQSWGNKFACALVGVAGAFRSQNSFWVHLPIAIAVLAIATFLQVESWRWVTLLLTIAMVISAELFNTAIEQLVEVVYPLRDPRIAKSLDTAAGAVLVTAVIAAVIGLIVLVPPILDCFTAAW